LRYRLPILWLLQWRRLFGLHHRVLSRIRAIRIKERNLVRIGRKEFQL